MSTAITNQPKAVENPDPNGEPTHLDTEIEENNYICCYIKRNGLCDLSSCLNDFFAALDKYIRYCCGDCCCDNEDLFQNTNYAPTSTEIHYNRDNSFNRNDNSDDFDCNDNDCCGWVGLLSDVDCGGCDYDGDDYGSGDCDDGDYGGGDCDDGDYGGGDYDDGDYGGGDYGGGDCGDGDYGGGDSGGGDYDGGNDD